MTDTLGSMVHDLFSGIARIIKQSNQDLVTILRQPTPIKITSFLQADGSGVIGGGFTNPQNAVTLWQCPMSMEGWVNRISVTIPGRGPGNPLAQGQGQAFATGSMGELIFMLPIAGTIAPIQITEGRISAAHVNSGERIIFFGDSFPANTIFRIDLQIVQVSGVSTNTPQEGLLPFTLGPATTEVID